MSWSMPLQTTQGHGKDIEFHSQHKAELPQDYEAELSEKLSTHLADALLLAADALPFLMRSTLGAA